MNASVLYVQPLLCVLPQPRLWSVTRQPQQTLLLKLTIKRRFSFQISTSFSSSESNYPLAKLFILRCWTHSTTAGALKLGRFTRHPTVVSRFERSGQQTKQLLWVCLIVKHISTERLLVLWCGDGTQLEWINCRLQINDSSWFYHCFLVLMAVCADVPLSTGTTLVNGVNLLHTEEPWRSKGWPCYQSNPGRLTPPTASTHKNWLADRDPWSYITWNNWDSRIVGLSTGNSDRRNRRSESSSLALLISAVTSTSRYKHMRLTTITAHIKRLEVD